LDNNSQNPAYYLKTGRELFYLKLDAPPTVDQDTRVRVTGPMLEGHTIDVTSIERADDSLAGPGISSKQQGYSFNAPDGSFVMLLARDQSAAADPYPAAEVIEEVITGSESAHSYFQEASFGQYGLTLDVLGWYTVDLTDCQDLGVQSALYNQVLSQAEAQDGFDHTQYRHVGVMFQLQEGACLGGRAYIGGGDSDRFSDGLLP
jgi:hypothetical protein